MSLADFIQELQTQDNIIYSQPPESAIHIIPPEKVSTRIIPPESIVQKPPTTIKLKIKQKDVTTAIQEPVKQQTPVKTMPQSNVIDLGGANTIIKKPPEHQLNKSTVIAQPISQQSTQSVIQKPPTQSVVTQPNIQPQVVQEQITDEQLFLKSGTESSKYAIWLDYFNKAKSSKKSNPIVDRMKIGRFTITPDNKVLLLPDYDIVGKDPDDVLKDKWF